MKIDSISVTISIEHSARISPETSQFLIEVQDGLAEPAGLSSAIASLAAQFNVLRSTHPNSSQFDEKFQNQVRLCEMEWNRFAAEGFKRIHRG
jgi:hypothetical protein